MPAYYTYIISSLPMLSFQSRPPFSFERFISICQGALTEKDMEALKSISRSGEYNYIDQPSLRSWYAFDRALRNELVKIRATRLHADAQEHIRGDGYVEPFISRAAMSAHRHTSPLEAERLLDLARWQYLEEIALGHYFDLDVLIIYGIKLLILERWEMIRRADREALLEAAVKTES